MEHSGTRPLQPSEIDEISVARARVFQTLDPFGEPFRSDVEHRALLFPVSCHLEDRQLTALAECARFVGDDHAILELLTPSDHDVPLWRLDFADGATYEELFFLENALYSSSGTWGMLISHNDHAVVGGTAGFIERLIGRFPATEYPTRHFIPGTADLPETDDTLEELLTNLTELGTEIDLRGDQVVGDEQVVAFIEFWRQLRTPAHPAEWLPTLLAHIYGSERASAFLRDNGWFT